MNENQLGNETSPYLLQHADNPVHWLAWSAQALAYAQQQNKPILLSIGYSACHWCHVMAHESFSDAETAAVMNQHFVNIKVDREERPDLDRIYQTAHQILNQRAGGWPLTIILSPDDQTPFFAGTYFPLEAKHGLPAFKDILLQVAAFYQQQHDQITEQNTALKKLLDDMLQINNRQQLLTPLPLDQARREYARHFDRQYAGFGKAPKFPHPTDLDRLLHHWHSSLASSVDEDALQMVQLTLHAMASGGVYDQLQGGFFRYCVDDYWMIPHFEKMLHDNGPLLCLFADAYAATKAATFFRVLHDTAHWVMHEMQADSGGYYATLDADSEGEEGKYYVWQTTELQQLLSVAEYQVFSQCYGLDRPANFEGHWHLHVFKPLEDIAEATQQDKETLQALLHSAREKCLQRREQRIKPGCDQKILASCNGLMIKGMACAGQRLANIEYIQSAQRAADFIRRHMFIDKRLYASYKDGEVRHPAYLDDYVFLMDGLLTLLQSHWRQQDFSLLLDLAQIVLDLFEDKHNGGFYFTANDHEKLFHRPKPVMDEATPAGNAIAAQLFLRLGYLLNEQRYIDAAQRTLLFAWQSISHAAYAHASMLNALDDYLYTPEIIIIRGSDDDIQKWSRSLQSRYQPKRLCLLISDAAAELPDSLREKAPARDVTTAYICSGQHCELPITDHAEFEQRLQQTVSNQRK